MNTSPFSNFNMNGPMNIMSMNQEAPDCLTLHAEANSGAPLLYALCQAYTNLDVEVKETEW